MIKKPRRFDIYLTTPNPDAGEQAAVRDGHQCLVLSPDEVNADSEVDTVSVAPIADTGVGYPTRVKVRINGKERTASVVPMTTGGRNRPDNLKVKTRFQGKDGNMILDQSRYIDKSRILKDLGDISKDEQQRLIRASRKHNL